MTILFDAIVAFPLLKVYLKNTRVSAIQNVNMQTILFDAIVAFPLLKVYLKNTRVSAIQNVNMQQRRKRWCWNADKVK